MKWINDLSDIYQYGIIEEGDVFKCSVCGKEYKRRSNAITHIDKQICHSNLDLLKDTMTEEIIYDLYVRVCHEFEMGYVMNMGKFRTSRTYNTLAKYVTFAQKHNLVKTQILDYFIFCFIKVNMDFNKAANFACKNETLKSFREFLISEPSLIDSEAFYERHMNELISDQSFLIRSIERGEIDVVFAFERFGDVFSNLNDIEKARVNKVIELRP